VSLSCGCCTRGVSRHKFETELGKYEKYDSGLQKCQFMKKPETENLELLYVRREIRNKVDLSNKTKMVIVREEFIF
jgi:hypothetical protein